MIVWHVETSSGPRFEWCQDEEELRVQLIAYNNDVLNEDDEDEQLPEDATLDEAIEKIEERENFSREDMDGAYVFDARSRDTILAALRLWQHAKEGSIGLYNKDSDTFEEIEREIACGDHGNPLIVDEIDALCERINT